MEVGINAGPLVSISLATIRSSLRMYAEAPRR
jgi:hypothetical protein